MNIKKGTLVTCPKCWAKLMSFNRDVSEGETFHHTMFDALTQAPEPGAALVSDCCMEPFIKIRNWKPCVHTELGWM